MRTACLIAMVLSFGLMGGTCLPLVDETTRDQPGGTTLALVLVAPDADRSVAEGDTLTISWTGANTTGDAVTVAVVAESRDDLSTTTLTTSSTITNGSYDWDTSGYSGSYKIRITATAGDQSIEKVSDAMITIDLPPTFEFTAPTEDVTFDPNNTLLISWVAGDSSASLEIGLDVDQDHTNDDEILIAQPDVPDPAAEDYLEWDGTTTSGSDVAGGVTYYLYAILSDGINPDVIVESPYRITVTDHADTGSSTNFQQPEDDVDFLDSQLDGDPPFEFEYYTNKTVDVLVDLLIDPDENHTNGNEIKLISRQYVAADENPDIFDWTGLDADGNEVPNGIYRPYIAVSTGSGTPATTEADGLVFRRDTEEQQLIGLLTPNSKTTVKAGGYVSITWQDGDPDGDATLSIFVDDDDQPNEDVETGEAELEILSKWEASGDGVRNTLAWQVPSSLDPGTYYVFAYIYPDGEAATPPDFVSVAAGAVVVESSTD